jgi:hypothetical protein
MATLAQRGQAATAAAAPVMGKLNDRPIFNTSYAGFGRVELQYPDDDYARERNVITTRNADIGCYPMTADELEAERALTWTIIKKLTMAVLSMDFTSFSFPVGYSEQRSFLERTADLFTFIADDYADQMNDSSVPETRLQLLATGIIAGFHIYMQSKKPWNPVLGETLVAAWPNGVTLYGEQVSHHPPISCFQIYDAHENWKCTARCQFTIHSGVSQVDLNQSGAFALEFSDGATYEWEFPQIIVLGIVKGDRIVYVRGPVKVKDTLNDIELEIELGPKPDKAKGIVKQRHSTIFGGILDGTGKSWASKMTGDYSKAIVVDGVETWSLEGNKARRPIAWVDDALLLPSDSRFRLDRMLLINGDLPKADEIKVVIEESQRREKKLRVLVPVAP